MCILSKDLEVIEASLVAERKVFKDAANAKIVDGNACYQDPGTVRRSV